jgi:hypothetical protein
VIRAGEVGKASEGDSEDRARMSELGFAKSIFLFVSTIGIRIY